MNFKRYFRFTYDTTIERGDIFISHTIFPNKTFIKAAILNQIGDSRIDKSDIMITNIYEFNNEQDYLEFQQ